MVEINQTRGNHILQSHTSKKQNIESTSPERPVSGVTDAGVTPSHAENTVFAPFRGRPFIYWSDANFLENIGVEETENI